MRPFDHEGSTSLTASENRTGAAPAVLPLVAAAAAAMRGEVALRLSVCLLTAIALLPVWWPATREYRFVRPVLWIGVGGCVLGAALSYFDAERAMDLGLMRGQTATMLAFVGAIGMLVWARASVGEGWTLIAFGVGGLVNVGLTGLSPENAWKYSLALPLSILVLGLVARVRSRLPVLAVLVVLIWISAGSDSRSFTAFLGATLALMTWQARPSTPGRGRPWLTVASVGAMVVAAYYLFQALILDGALGAAAQQRSQAQLDATGSLISGGRPELGASVALLRGQPWGYGSGTVPTPTDIYLAKTGMSQLNYDPDNGYVDVFMFGGHYEVHSVLGDLWIRFGLLGAAMVALMVAVSLIGTVQRIALGLAPAGLILLATLGAWDTLFSPFLTSYRTLALLFAISAPPAAARWRTAQGSRSATPSIGPLTYPSGVAGRARRAMPP